VIEERLLSDISKWGAQQQGAVEFFLRRPRNESQEFAKREFGADGITPIIPLAVGSTRRKVQALKWWVGWRERWVAHGAREFSFDTAGWSLFCSRSDEDPFLLIRAEWDQVDPAKPPNAGQPHWHVHRVLDTFDRKVTSERGEAVFSRFAGEQSLELPESDVSVTLAVPPIEWPGEEGLQEEITLTESRTTSEGLVEEVEEAVPHLGITRVHLGMGGWTHPGISPSCWQYPFGDDLIQVISRWSVEALRYMQSQLPYIDLVSPSQ